MRSFPPDLAEMRAIHDAQPVEAGALGPQPEQVHIMESGLKFSLSHGETSAGAPTIKANSELRPDLNLTLTQDLGQAMVDLQGRHTLHTQMAADHQKLADDTLIQIKVLSQVQTKLKVEGNGT